MTREEAIDILRSYLMFDKSSMQIDIALNMAIEALKGGDAEMLNEDFRPKYMQQSRHDDGKMTMEQAAKWVKFVHDVLYEDKDEEIREALNIAIEALTNVKNMHKGEWIKKQVFIPELDKYVPFIECSVCGYEPYYGGSESKLNYCANCGAKMGGDREC